MLLGAALTTLGLLPAYVKRVLVQLVSGVPLNSHFCGSWTSVWWNGSFCKSSITAIAFQEFASRIPRRSTEGLNWTYLQIRLSMNQIRNTPSLTERGWRTDCRQAHMSICMAPSQMLWISRGVCVTGGMDVYAAEATVRLIDGQTGRNIAFLARSEFRDLSPPPDWSLVTRLGTAFAWTRIAFSLGQS